MSDVDLNLGTLRTLSPRRLHELAVEAAKDVSAAWFDLARIFHMLRITSAWTQFGFASLEDYARVLCREVDADTVRLWGTIVRDLHLGGSVSGEILNNVGWTKASFLLRVPRKALGPWLEVAQAVDLGTLRARIAGESKTTSFAPPPSVGAVEAEFSQILRSLVGEAEKVKSESASDIRRFAELRECRPLLRTAAEQVLESSYRFADLRASRTKDDREIYIPLRVLDRIVYAWLAQRLAEPLERSGVQVRLHRKEILTGIGQAVVHGSRDYFRTDIERAFVSTPLQDSLDALRGNIPPWLARQLYRMLRIWIFDSYGRQPLTFVPPGVSVSSALLAAYLWDFVPSIPGTHAVLYVDDVVGLAPTPDHRDRLLELIRTRARWKGLKLNAGKTWRGHIRDGLHFLGGVLRNLTWYPSEELEVACALATRDPSVSPERIAGLLGALGDIPGRRSRVLRRSLMATLAARERTRLPIGRMKTPVTGSHALGHTPGLVGTAGHCLKGRPAVWNPAPTPTRRTEAGSCP